MKTFLKLIDPPIPFAKLAGKAAGFDSGRVGNINWIYVLSPPVYENGARH